MLLEKSNIGFVQTSTKILHQIQDNYQYKTDYIDNHISKINKLCNEPLNLAVMGEFNAGKSSFINKLLGFDILPTGIVPKTATIIKVKYGTEAKIEIRYKKNGKTIIEQSDDITKLKTFQDAKNINNKAFIEKINAIDEIIIYNDNDLLKNFTFIDTPGFNHNKAMDETTRSIFKEVDMAIWLITKNQATKKTEIDELEVLKQYVDKIMLIVNKSDINTEDQDEDSIRENIKNNFGHIISNVNDVHFIASKQKLDDIQELNFQNFLHSLKRSALEDDVKISIDLLKKEFTLFSKHLNKDLIQWQELDQNLSELLDYKKNLLLDMKPIVQTINTNITNKLKTLILQLDQINSSYKSVNQYAIMYIIEDFFEKNLKKDIVNLHRANIQKIMQSAFKIIKEKLNSSKLKGNKEKDEIFIAMNMIEEGLIQDIISSLSLLGAIKFYLHTELANRNIIEKVLKTSVNKNIIDNMILVYQDDIDTTLNIILNNQYITKNIKNILELSNKHIQQIKEIEEILQGVL